MIQVRWKETQGKGKDKTEVQRAGRVVTAVVKGGQTYLVIYTDDATFIEKPLEDMRPW